MSPHEVRILRIFWIFFSISKQPLHRFFFFFQFYLFSVFQRIGTFKKIKKILIVFFHLCFFHMKSTTNKKFGILNVKNSLIFKLICCCLFVVIFSRIPIGELFISARGARFQESKVSR